MLVAAAFDLRTRKIPNRLTYAGILTGLAWSAWLGWTSLGGACIGMLAAGGMGAALFSLGGMGGGDVKLMAAVGAWLGFPRTIDFLLLTFLAAAVVAVAMLLLQSKPWESFRREVQAFQNRQSAGLRVPFALAAAIGIVWLVVVPHSLAGLG